MRSSTALAEKRQALQDRLSDGQRTLVGLVLGRVGLLIQKMSRRPRPTALWYSALLVAVLVLLLDFGISLALGEFRSSYRSNFVWVETVVAGIIFALPTALDAHLGYLFRVLRESLVHEIQDVDSLADLEGWIARVQSAGGALLLGLACALVGSSYFLVPQIALGQEIRTVGPLTLGGVFFLVCGAALYHSIHVLVLPLRLSRWRLRIYALDPSSSQVVEDVSNIAMTFTYVVGAFMAAVTLVLALIGWTAAPAIVPVVAVAWAFIIALFATSQYALHQLIVRTKRGTLNDLQMTIERLHAEGDLAEKDTVEALNRLLDYYERIKETPNSALNLRTGLGFINSLLLPLLAFLLANLEHIIGLFRPGG